MNDTSIKFYSNSGKEYEVDSVNAHDVFQFLSGKWFKNITITFIGEQFYSYIESNYIPYDTIFEVGKSYFYSECKNTYVEVNDMNVEMEKSHLNLIIMKQNDKIKYIDDVIVRTSYSIVPER